MFAQFSLPEDTTNQNMVKVVNNIKKVSSAPIGQGTLGGYFSADAFIAAVKKAGKNLTTDSFAKVLTKFTYQIKGVIGPTKYPQSRTLGAPCGTLAHEQRDGVRDHGPVRVLPGHQLRDAEARQVLGGRPAFETLNIGGGRAFGSGHHHIPSTRSHQWTTS